ncbi:aminoglycoside 6-adenylyltransferase [Enterococcus sp. DIV0086]|uniref:aminoglycoside 6-adenylyltransferase n=1 Tax=Enterococcus sp. DIV0086 TaxID=2774655 RepID=UPI003D2D5134
MRSEKDIMDLLETFFYQSDDLLVFLMNGSKINVNIPDDKFKDFDVAFFTNNSAKYKGNSEFIKKNFGEILLMTEPFNPFNLELFKDESDGKRYSYLIQFVDGNRIDMSFYELDYLEEYLKSDSLTKLICDKTNRIKEEMVPSDADYLLRYPSSEVIKECIKEFWWQFLNTLKSVARNNYLLAQKYLNYTREQLIQMLTWQVALDNGFDKNYGKEFTNITNFLSPKNLNLLQQTFNTTDFESMISSLKIMKMLEVKVEKILSDRMSFDYTDYSYIPRNYLISKDEEELASYF